MRLSTFLLSSFCTIIYCSTTEAFAPWTTTIRPTVKKGYPKYTKTLSFATVSETKNTSKELFDPAKGKAISGSFLGKPIPYSELTIGVLRETYPGERRVSQSPDSVRNLVKEGFKVVVQAGGEKRAKAQDIF